MLGPEEELLEDEQNNMQEIIQTTIYDVINRSEKFGSSTGESADDESKLKAILK